MIHIGTISPAQPGGYAPLLAGAFSPPFLGTPVFLGLDLGGIASAVLAAECFDETAVVRWVAVDKPCQGRRFGGRLLDAFCDAAFFSGAQAIDAVVCLPDGDREKAAGLFMTHGFSLLSESETYRFPLSALLSGPLANDPPHPNVKPLSDVPRSAVNAFNRRVMETEGLLVPPVRMQGLLPESVVWMENDRIAGCVLAAPCADGIELQWLYGTSAAMIRGLLSGACRLAARRVSPDTPIFAAALVPEAAPLVRRLAGAELRQEAPVLHFRREAPRQTEQKG